MLSRSNSLSSTDRQVPLTVAPQRANEAPGAPGSSTGDQNAGPAVGPGIGAVQQLNALEQADVPRGEGGARRGDVQNAGSHAPVISSEELDEMLDEVARGVQIDDLIYAIKTADTDRVRALLEDHATHVDFCELDQQSPNDLFNEEQDGQTAAEAAAAYGRTDILKMLIEQGASVNPPLRPDATSPLGWAASNGCMDCVRLLLDLEADIDLRSGEQGEEASPYELAIQNGHPEVAEWLLEYGANTNPR